MIDRYSMHTPLAHVAKVFQASLPPIHSSFKTRFIYRGNVHCMASVLIVRKTAAGRELAFVNWALAPPSVDEIESHRCIIPANGFFEMVKAPKEMVPYYFRLKSNELFGFAGRSQPGRKVDICSIVYTTPNELVARYDNEMPAILSPNDYDEWLDPAAKNPERLIAPFPAEELMKYRAHPFATHPKYTGEQCIAPFSPKHSRLCGD